MLIHISKAQVGIVLRLGHHLEVGNLDALLLQCQIAVSSTQVRPLRAKCASDDVSQAAQDDGLVNGHRFDASKADDRLRVQVQQTV